MLDIEYIGGIVLWAYGFIVLRSSISIENHKRQGDWNVTPRTDRNIRESIYDHRKCGGCFQYSMLGGKGKV